MTVMGAVPVKPFASSKQRLAESLPARARETISMEMAQRTMQCLDSVGSDPIVIAADEEVATWAVERGWQVVVDRGDLNSAGHTAIEKAASVGKPWLMLHADLPLLSPAALTRAVRILGDGGSVISPSRDGGTSLIGSSARSFSFAYGAASFHAHLQRIQSLDPVVLVDVRLAIDLDDFSDLSFAAARVGWLAELLDTLTRS